MQSIAKTRRRPKDAAMLLGPRQSQHMGRPTLYKPEYDEAVVLWGKQGKSRAEICSLLNIARNTLNDWERQYSTFRDSLARAREHSQAWWESTAQKSLKRKHFQAQLWRYSMAGRFKEDYADNAQSDTISAMTDFLQAVTQAAQARIPATPGDGAKVINPLDAVVSGDPHDAVKTPKR